MKIFPIRPGLKTPLTANGLHDATDDPTQLQAWRERFPDCNWAVNCGESGLTVIDIDPRHGGTEAHLNALPQSLTVRTGGGGWHVYFRGVGPSRTALEPGVDVKSTGGYVLIPPSVTVPQKPTDDPKNFGGYSVERNLPIADLPTELANAIGRGRAKTGAPVEVDCPPHLTRDDRWLEHARAHLRNLLPAVSGEGGTKLFTAAMVIMRGWLLTRAAADALLREDFNPRCSPPWDFDNAEHAQNWEHQLDDAEAKGSVAWGSKRPTRDGLNDVHCDHPDEMLAQAASTTPAPRQDTSGLQLAPGGWPWVLRKGNWCWLHHSDRQGYWGPIEKADIRLQIRRTHGHLVGLRGPRGGDIQEHDFEQIYVQRVDSLRATYIARESTWDPTKLELTLRQLRWAEFPATFHADIDTWLRALAGACYPVLAQWLASCVALNRPAPALYLHGDANVGKTLLAVGLARLWTCEQPAPFKESLADFNEAAATCPLVFADEGFPDGMSFAEFREMVTAPSRRVNEKYKAKYPVLGYVRIILAANNANALRYQRTGALTAADIRAVADRLLVINARPEAQSLLAGFDRQSMAEKRIAEHVLWLASTVALESVESRMSAKPGGAMALLDALQTARYAEPMRTLGGLMKSDAKVAAGAGVYPRDGRVLVNTPALFKACLKPFQLQFQPNAPKEQDVRDFVNAFRTGPAEWVWADGRSVKVNPVDWTRIAAQLEQLE